MKVHKTNYTIEVLRFIFSITVMLFHFKGTKNYFSNGYFGVEFFFIISGYLMAVNAEKYTNLNTLSIWEYNIRYVIKKFTSFFVPCLILQLVCFFIDHIQANEMSVKVLISDFLSFPFVILLLRQWGFSYAEYNNVVWYLSAMIITIFICFPLLLKYKEKYTLYIAPIITLSILGYCSHRDGYISGIGTYWVFIYKSTLRAFAVMNLGIILHSLVGYLKKFKFTNKGRVCLFFTELVSFSIPLWFSVSDTNDNYELEALFFLCIGIIISFLAITPIDVYFNHHYYIPQKLGKLSLYIYLVHCPVLWYINPHINNLVSDKATRLIIYLLCVFISSWIVMIITNYINNKILLQIKSFLIMLPK